MRALIPPFKPTVVCVSWFLQNFSHLRSSAVSTCTETNPHCLPIAQFLLARLRLDEDTLCVRFKCCIKVHWQTLICGSHEKKRRAKTESNNTIWTYFQGRKLSSLYWRTTGCIHIHRSCTLSWSVLEAWHCGPPLRKKTRQPAPISTLILVSPVVSQIFN